MEDFGPLGPFWDPWPLFKSRILDPLGPFGTLGPYLIFVFWTPWALLGPLDPIMSDFYETLLFWGMQEAFWKIQNGSEKPEWF